MGRFGTGKPCFDFMQWRTGIISPVMKATDVNLGSWDWTSGVGTPLSDQDARISILIYPIENYQGVYLITSFCNQIFKTKNHTKTFCADVSTMYKLYLDTSPPICWLAEVFYIPPQSPQGEAKETNRANCYINIPRQWLIDSLVALRSCHIKNRHTPNRMQFHLASRLWDPN